MLNSSFLIDHDHDPSKIEILDVTGVQEHDMSERFVSVKCLDGIALANVTAFKADAYLSGNIHFPCVPKKAFYAITNRDIYSKLPFPELFNVIDLIVWTDILNYNSVLLCLGNKLEEAILRASKSVFTGINDAEEAHQNNVLGKIAECVAKLSPAAFKAICWEGVIIPI